MTLHENHEQFDVKTCIPQTHLEDCMPEDSSYTNTNPVCLPSTTMFISAHSILNRVIGMAKEIDQYYGHQEIVVVPLFMGATMFVADLLRQLSVQTVCLPLLASAYRGQQSSRQLKLAWLSHQIGSMTEKHLLIVDDILDTGSTIGNVQQMLLQFEPTTIRSCVLLCRRSSFNRPFVHFVGFDLLGDHFMVGYGMDCDGRYRGLCDIMAVGRDGGLL